jgi:hypothetical protein
MAETEAAPPRYLVIAVGESHEPVMEIAEGYVGVRSAVARMCFGSEEHADWEAVHEYLACFDNPDCWSLDGARFNIEFEIGGIEITRLLIQP